MFCFNVGINKFLFLFSIEKEVLKIIPVKFVSHRRKIMHLVNL